MARSAIVLQDFVDTGLEATYEAANVLGNSFTNDGQVILHIINASVGDITVTVVTGGTLGGKAVTDTAVVVTAAEERFIGPFPPALYNQTDGTVNVDYSGVTTLTVAALQL